mgnify:CR=1 FL=1
MEMRFLDTAKNFLESGAKLLNYANYTVGGCIRL